jgi:hypothetical protein
MTQERSRVRLHSDNRSGASHVKQRAWSSLMHMGKAVNPPLSLSLSL